MQIRTFNSLKRLYQANFASNKSILKIYHVNNSFKYQYISFFFLFYKEAVEKKVIRNDPRQMHTVFNNLFKYSMYFLVFSSKITLLDKLRQEILESHQEWKNHNVSYSYHTGYESEYDDGDGHHNTTGGLFSSFFSKAKKNTDKNEKKQENNSTKNQKIRKTRGIYLYGTPGCGKTFMMDMFFENIDILEKKRVHFNEFMLSIHDQMHRIKSVSSISFE